MIIFLHPFTLTNDFKYVIIENQRRGMLNIITFKGEKHREKFVERSEELRKQKIFHTGRLLKNSSMISYKDNVRGLEKLEES